MQFTGLNSKDLRRRKWDRVRVLFLSVWISLKRWQKLTGISSWCCSLNYPVILVANISVNPSPTPRKKDHNNKTINSDKWLAEGTHGEGFHELLEFLRREEVTDVMLASRHLRQLLRPVWRRQKCTRSTSENNNKNKQTIQEFYRLPK